MTHECSSYHFEDGEKEEEEEEEMCYAKLDLKYIHLV